MGGSCCLLCARFCFLPGAIGLECLQLRGKKLFPHLVTHSVKCLMHRIIYVFVWPGLLPTGGMSFVHHRILPPTMEDQDNSTKACWLTHPVALVYLPHQFFSYV